MRALILCLLVGGTAAACVSSPATQGSAASLVGQPLASTVRAIGYLPDAREQRADRTVYVWHIGNMDRIGNRPATSETIGATIPLHCTVSATVDGTNLVRDLALEGTGGRCARVARQLRRAAS